MDREPTKTRLLKELADARKRISELEQSEVVRNLEKEALQETGRLYREVYNIAPLAFVIWDLNCRITDWNKCAEAVFGWTRDEVLGRNFFEFLIPARAQLGVDMAVSALLQNELPNRHINENLTKSGEIILCEWNNSIRYDSAGRPIGAISLALEITERKRTEEKLRQSEKRYRELYEGSRDGYAMVDMRGRITECNSVFRELLGYSVEELLQKTYEDITPESWHSMEAEILEQQVLKRGFSDLYEKEYIRKDGTIFPIEIRTYLVKDEGGNSVGMWAFIRDITDRRRAEKALLDAKDQLEIKVEQRTEELRKKNEELEGLIYSVSHDLQAPLRTIQGHYNALMENLADRLEDKHQDNLRAIGQVAENMNRLIGEMLVYASMGIQSFSKTRVSLESVFNYSQFELVEDIIASETVIRVARPLLEVTGHERTLVRLLTNLLSNAMKFVPPGCRPEIDIESVRSGDRVHVSVRDNGLGIPHEFKKRIFRMFERVHSREQYSGTGIGLAIAKKAVELHGGEIGVDSEPGKGSTFWFDIPD